MGDLKSCPMCGKRCEHWDVSVIDGKPVRKHFVRCGYGVWSGCDYRTAYADTPAEARRLHNEAVERIRRDET